MGAGGKDVFSGAEAAPHLLSSCWRRSTQERTLPPHHPRGQKEAHAGEGAHPWPQVQTSLTRRIPEGRDLAPFCPGQGLLHRRHSNICWMYSEPDPLSLAFPGDRTAKLPQKPLDCPPCSHQFRLLTTENSDLQRPQHQAQDSQETLEAKGRKPPPLASLQHLHECPQALPHCRSLASWVGDRKLGPKGWGPQRQPACSVYKDQHSRDVWQSLKFLRFLPDCF